MEQHESEYGLSLIELLVVCGIMVVFLGIAIASLNRASDNQELVVVGKKIVTTLRNLQTSAVAGSKPSSNCDTLNGYEISFAANYIDQRPACASAVATPAYQRTYLTTNPFIALVTVTDSAPAPLTFKVLSQGASPPTRICIRDSSQNKKYEIRITNTGEIQDLGIISSGDYTVCQSP